MKKAFSPFFTFWVLPGFSAGLVFLGIAFISSAMTTRLWAMPDAIASTLGMATPAGYGFAPGPVLVGIAVHLAFSIGLGVIFTAFARWRQLHGWLLVVAGVLFMMLETSIAIWVVLHSLLPSSTFVYFLGAVPWWGSVTGRCMYGLVLGLLLSRFVNWRTPKPATRLLGAGI